MKKLELKIYKKYWEKFYKELKKVILAPFEKIIKEDFENELKKEEIYNSLEDYLITKIKSFKIEYDGEKFFGKLDSKVVKYLYELGGKYDGRNKAIKIEINKLPQDVLITLTNVKFKKEQMHEKIIKKIANIKFDDNKLISDIKNNYINTMLQFENKISDNVKKIGIQVFKNPKYIELLSEKYATQFVRYYATRWTMRETLEIRQKILENLARGGHINIMKKIFEKFKDVSDKKIKFWARQETHLALSHLRNEKMKEAGSKKYEWRCTFVGAGRPRDTHRVLHGKIFSWDNPPVVSQDGRRAHAGEDYNCYCTARAIFD